MQPLDTLRSTRIPQQMPHTTPRQATGSAERGAPYSATEDIVSLSTGYGGAPAAVDTRKPSQSVTAVERKALRDSFSVYA
jgi:hypothetical protein